MCYSFLFYNNNGCTDPRQCYVYMYIVCVVGNPATHLLRKLCIVKSSTQYVCLCLYAVVSGRKKAALGESWYPLSWHLDLDLNDETFGLLTSGHLRRFNVLKVIVGVKYRHFLSWVLQNACTEPHVIAWIYVPISAGRYGMLMFCGREIRCVIGIVASHLSLYKSFLFYRVFFFLLSFQCFIGPRMWII